MYCTGLDWSGDPGDPKKTPGKSTRLVTAVAHIAWDEWQELERALAHARTERNLPDDYVFHFSDCRDSVREEFIKALARVSLCAHARLCDKALWPAPYIRATTGPGRIQDQIVALVVACPDSVTSGQTLLIDGQKIRGGKIPSPKGALNRSLASKGRRGLGKVRFCADHSPSQGAIIQVADMIAGALNDSWGISGQYLSRIRGKVTLV